MSESRDIHQFVSAGGLACMYCGEDCEHPVHRLDEPTPRTIDELRELLDTQLASLTERDEQVAYLEAAMNTLRRELSEQSAKITNQQHQLARYHNEGTGLGAEIIRIIQHAADRGYVDVCISSPEPMTDASGMRMGDAGWTITLGKRQP